MLEKSQVKGLLKLELDLNTTVDFSIDNRALINTNKSIQDAQQLDIDVLKSTQSSFQTSINNLLLVQGNQQTSIDTLQSTTSNLQTQIDNVDATKNVMVDEYSGVSFQMFVSGNKVGLREL